MNAERLAEIKAWLEHIDPAYKNHDVVVDSRDLIAALEAAQERIATLEAQRDVLFTIADAVLPSDFVKNKELGEAWRHAYSIGALK